MMLTLPGQGSTIGAGKARQDTATGCLLWAKHCTSLSAETLELRISKASDEGTLMSRAPEES